MSDGTDKLKEAVAALKLPPEIAQLFEETYERGAHDVIETAYDAMAAACRLNGASVLSLAEVRASLDKVLLLLHIRTLDASGNPIRVVEHFARKQAQEEGTELYQRAWDDAVAYCKERIAHTGPADPASKQT